MTLLSTGAGFVVACLLAAACREHAPRPASVLLFNGSGASGGDVAAVAAILRDEHLDYSTANSRQLGAMSDGQIRAYRLLIVPGGNFVEFGTGLTPATVAHVRNAVRGGLNYLGICGGAFFAGHSPYNGLDLTSGVSFPFYAAEARGIRKTAIRISIAGALPLEQYWEDGPQLSGWGEVVARYPDGTPAIAQGRVG
ncbi:MAG TPA: BPL-N domain-containing protein, partial [Gemmatimonadaceae bacterium]|nr:BPL-N domain-containing protein [Gemmatimonadaceae bacterium]